MENQSSHQPLAALLPVGIAATLVVLAISGCIAASFTAPVFSTWVAFWFMAATPTQIILALLWRTQVPARIGAMHQPLKGVAFLALTLAGAVLFGAALFYFAGGGVAPPTPMLIMYTILTIVVTLWFVPVFHCWPVSLLVSRPVPMGLLSLLFCYLLAYALFLVLFDFDFMSGAPVYVARLDPGGLFMAFAPLTFAVTTVSMVMLCVLLDFWPSRRIAGDAQPKLGLVTAVMVLVAATLVYGCFTRLMGMDIVAFLVRVPVSLIFGVFLVNNLMQHQLFAAIPQPRRGLLLILIAIVLSQVLHALYTWAAPWLAGAALASGPPAHQLELWVASAMLGVTFPVIIVVAEYFAFWPIRRQRG